MSAESPTPLHRPARIPYQPALNGLRGIALLVMLAYHGNVSWLGGGYLSVSTFFTLSGFLITALLVIEQESNPSGRIDLGAFRRLAHVDETQPGDAVVRVTIDE